MEIRNYVVVGVTFEHRQDILSDFYKNYHHGTHYDVNLIKEDNNPYDSNAVAVNIDVNGEMKNVGYISKKENVELRQRFDKIKNAHVRSIGPNINGDLGLSINVEFDD